jgi:hypothetical protein
MIGRRDRWIGRETGHYGLARSLDAHEPLAQMLIEAPFNSVRADSRFEAQLARLEFRPYAVAAISRDA